MMNRSAISSTKKTSTASSSPPSASSEQASTCFPSHVMLGNISDDNVEGGADGVPASPSAPSAPGQVLKGEQIFTGTFENHNVYADPEISPMTNSNEAESHGPDPKLQFTRMQDIGDGIRVSVPPPDVDYDQEASDVPRSQLPSMPPAHLPSKGVNGAKSVNSNNYNFNSGNIGSTIRGGGQWSADANWARLQQSLLQQFMNNTSGNNINSNNGNFNSGNLWSNIE